jgi:hypothetical protein
MRKQAWLAWRSRDLYPHLEFSLDMRRLRDGATRWEMSGREGAALRRGKRASSAFVKSSII